MVSSIMEEINFSDPDPVTRAFGDFDGNPPIPSTQTAAAAPASNKSTVSNDNTFRLPRTGGTLANRGAFLRDTIESQLPTNEQLQKRKQQAGKALKSLGSKLNKINLVRLIDQMEQNQQLADSLEQLNSRMKEEVERHEVRREAEQLSLKVIIDHLNDFLKDHPVGTYEEWISDLHPENANQGQLLEDIQQIDERFYVMESDHRKLWNKTIEEQCKTQLNDKSSYSHRLVEARTQIWGKIASDTQKQPCMSNAIGFSDVPIDYRETTARTTDGNPKIDLLSGSVEFNPNPTQMATKSADDNCIEEIDFFAPDPIINHTTTAPNTPQQDDPFQDLIKF